MKEYSRETDARIVIDDLLRQALWNPADKSMVLTEVPIHSIHGRGVSAEGGGTEGAVITAGTDEIPTGRADYVLLSQNVHPLAVVEAVVYILAKYSTESRGVPIYGEERLEKRHQTLNIAKAQIPALQTCRKGPGEKIPDWGLLEGLSTASMSPGR